MDTHVVCRWQYSVGPEVLQGHRAADGVVAVEVVVRKIVERMVVAVEEVSVAEGKVEGSSAEVGAAAAAFATVHAAMHERAWVAAVAEFVAVAVACSLQDSAGPCDP